MPSLPLAGLHATLRRPASLVILVLWLSAGCSDEAQTRHEEQLPASGAPLPRTEAVSGMDRPDEGQPDGITSGADGQAWPWPRLLTRRQRSLPDKTESVNAGDVDGDGRTDLLVTTLTPGHLHVFCGTPRGLAASSRATRVGGYPLQPLLMEPGPDGGRTVALAVRETRRLLFLAPLAPTAERVLSSHALPGTPRAVALGDLEQDGELEVLVATDGPWLVLLDRTGPIAEYSLQASLPRCLHVSADGQTVVVGSQASRSLVFFPAHGAALGPPQRELTLPGIPRAMCELDADGDGDAELLVAGGDHELWVLGLGAAGGVAAADGPDSTWKLPAVPIDLQSLPASLSTPLELLALSHATLRYTRLGQLSADGAGSRSSGYAGQTPMSAVLADLDADGLRDLVVANRDSLAISIIAGAGPTTLVQPQHVGVGGFPNGLAAGDLDGDGRLDALSLNSKDDDISILLNREGRLVAQGRVAAGPGPTSPALADLDGDGHLDLALLLSDSGGSRLARLFGDGSGSLQRSPQTPDEVLGQGVGVLRLQDVDADGRPEVLVAMPEQNRVVLYAPPGRAALRPLVELQLDGRPADLTLLELDGDPWRELVVALAGHGGSRRGLLRFDLEPDGNGLRAVEGEHIPLAVSPQALAAGDLDGNGLTDLAVLARISPGSTQGRLVPLFQFEHAGQRSLQSWTSLHTSLAPRDIDLADLDGDGLPEVIVCAQYSHVIDLWSPRPSADGKLIELIRQDGLGSHIGPMSAVAVDIDQDGWLDLIVANGHSDDVSTLFNAGGR